MFFPEIFTRKHDLSRARRRSTFATATFFAILCVGCELGGTGGGDAFDAGSGAISGATSVSVGRNVFESISESIFEAFFSGSAPAFAAPADGLTSVYGPGSSGGAIGSDAFLDAATAEARASRASAPSVPPTSNEPAPSSAASFASTSNPTTFSTTTFSTTTT